MADSDYLADVHTSAKEGCTDGTAYVSRRVPRWK